MDDADALLQQGIALARAGQKEQAYTVLRRALFISGDDATLRIWLGATAPTLPDALAHLEQAVALEPHNPQAQAGLQWVHQQMEAAPAPPAAPPDPPRTGGGLRRPFAPAPAEPSPPPSSPAPGRSRGGWASRTPTSAPRRPTMPRRRRAAWWRGLWTRRGRRRPRWQAA